MATQAEIGIHLDLSQGAVSQLLGQLGIPRGEHGYPLDEVRVGYIRRLREQAAGRSGEDGRLNLAEERAKLAIQQGELLDLKIGRESGALLPRDAVSTVVQEANARVRARLLAIPPRFSPIVAMLSDPVAVQAKLVEGVHEALAELAATDVLIGEAAEPDADPDRQPGSGGSGEELVAGVRTAAEADGEPVGRRKPRAQQRGQRRARKVED